MGWSNSLRLFRKSKKRVPKRIPDTFGSLEEVTAALRSAGLESSQLIIGVDFTKSNEWQGENSFRGQNLHSIDSEDLNPYEEAILIIGKTLKPFDDDQLIPCYGFGDLTTTDRGVFGFWEGGEPGVGLDSVISRYRDLVGRVQLCGPTSFAPLIRQAIQVVVDSGNQYHVLLVLADGQVTDHCRQETVDALVKASSYPLSVIMVGVGDGPWDAMERFDDHIFHRKFDNFQFVNFTRIMEESTNQADSSINVGQREAFFALHALMEIPQQYKAIQTLGLLRKPPPKKAQHVPPPLPPPSTPLQGSRASSQNVQPAPWARLE